MSIQRCCPPTEFPRFPEDDPTSAMRQARYQARIAAVEVADVEDELYRRLPELFGDRTNALTPALNDLMAQPPEDRWELDGLVKHYPYRYLVEVGRAFVRLVGESHIACGDRVEEQPF
jgi:hypothetical protein